MLNVEWIPTQILVGWRGNHDFPAGKKVIGIPYTQNRQKNAAGFLAVLSAADFYDSKPVNGTIMPTYGNDCSGFLSFAWNISRQTTYTFTEGIKNGTYAQVGSYSANAEKPNQSDLKNSYNYLKRGDGLVCRIGKDGHALLVAVPDPENEVVHVYEQTPPQTTINTWTYGDLAMGGYKPFTQSSTDGWYKINGYWYYLKPGTGAMASNESLVIDGKAYHFDSSGICTNP